MDSGTQTTSSAMSSGALSLLEPYAGHGFEAMAADEERALRKLGVYIQRPAAGGFLMLRIRIPGGNLQPSSMGVIADLADEYGRGIVDITVRQNLQLHWIRPQDAAVIISRLEAAGLSTIESGGAVVRNIVNCPVSGAGENELYDTSELVRELTSLFSNTSDFGDLPRKFKITVTGCALLCTYPEIQDIGVFAVRDRATCRVAFRARVGGGLSGAPRFGRDLGVLAEPGQVTEMCAAIARVFAERANSAGKSRGPSYVVDEAEMPAFRKAIEERMGSALRPALYQAPRAVVRDRSHIGIHGQGLQGLYCMGLSVPGGRMDSRAVRSIGALASQYGSGRVRTTNTQDIIVLDVPESHLAALAENVEAAGFDYEPGWAKRGMLACTGTEFCRLALTETKSRVADLGRYLDRAIHLDEPIRISITGCPNSCGQHHICDVGLEGSVSVIEGVRTEAFQVFLGGGVRGRENVGRRIGVKIPADDLGRALVGLFTQYKQMRQSGETFQDFCHRHPDAELAQFLKADSAIGPQHLDTIHTRAQFLEL